MWKILPILSLIASAVTPAVAQPSRPPNIVYVYADDLGYAELGCYGQERIRTPRLDLLAAEGMRFTQHYSGSSVCAPARAALLTGKHTGRAAVRDNHELQPWGQYPLPPSEITVATLLKRIGYATAVIGKWGLGPVGSEGAPDRHGFDLFFGYDCQRQAHTYYPSHLWRNSHRIDLTAWNGTFPRKEDGFLLAREYERVEGDPRDFFGRFSGGVYSPDLMIEEALRFVRDSRNQPFFLYFATPVPHVTVQVPDDSLREYLGLGWDDQPFMGSNMYLPHPAPRAAYAAMITRMDRDIGRLVDLVEELGLSETTIFMFSSDNGPIGRHGGGAEFFESAGPLRAGKGSFYEGGIRVPMIARWKGRIAPASVTNHTSYQPDFLPTALDLAGRIDLQPEGVTGISFAPTILGNPERQRNHEFLYWERRAEPGSQAVRMGDWKAIRFGGDNGLPGPVQLYDLATDIGERIDISSAHPQVVTRMEQILREARRPSAVFPLRMLGESGSATGSR
jgi:arylsulfatase A